MAVAFNGMFTAVPVAGVRVMVLISTKKERRFVLGGGVSGVAVSVRLSDAVPAAAAIHVQGGLGLPLHATKPFAYKFHAVSDKVILGHCASVPTLGRRSTLPWGFMNFRRLYASLLSLFAFGFGRMQRQAQSALHRELRRQRDRVA